MTTTVLDPASFLAKTDEKIDRTTDPDRLRNLNLFRERLVGELLGDTDRVFATATDDFALVTRASGSAETVAELPEFRAMFSGAVDAGIVVWCEWDHLALDGDELIAEGTLVSVLPAAMAGLATDGPDVLALSRTHGVVILEFADGLISREVVYTDPASRTIVPIPKSAIPDRAALAAAVLPVRG